MNHIYSGESDSVKDIFIILSWCIYTLSVGYAVIGVICKKPDFIIPEKCSLAFMSGLGGISVCMFIAGYLGFGFSRIVILSVLSVFSLVGVYLFFKDIYSGGKVRLKFNFSKIQICFLFLILLLLGYTFYRSIIMPIESYDSVSIYALKSKIIYLNNGIFNNFFKYLSENFHGTHPDYPLLVPMAEVWFYEFCNNFNEFAVKGIFPLYFIFFAVIFYCSLSRYVKNRTHLLIWTFMVCSVPQFNNYATIGVADLILSINFFVSFIYLYKWIFDKKRNSYLVISAIFSALTLWTKNEGMLLVLFNIILILPSLLSRESRSHLVKTSLYIFSIFLLILAWNLFKSKNGLINDNFTFSMINLPNFLTGINKIPAILYEYQKQFFGFKKWNICWILCFAIIALRGKSIFKDNNLPFCVVISLFFASYSFMYVFSQVEIHFFLSKTFSRFLLHIFPVVFFWAGMLSKDYLSEHHMDKRR